LEWCWMILRVSCLPWVLWMQWICEVDPKGWTVLKGC
jgi:hypothetical protein